MIDGAAAAKVRVLIDSLDRICPACLAATSDAVSEALHRGRSCPTADARAAPAPRDG